MRPPDLTIAQVAENLQVSRDFVREVLIRQGYLRAYRLTGGSRAAWRITAQALEDYKRQREEDFDS